MKFERLPPLGPLQTWRAASDGFSFVICHEPLSLGPQHQGYTATWKSRAHDIRPALPGLGGTQPANRIDGGPWRTFAEAEAACEATLRHLRKRQ